MLRAVSFPGVHSLDREKHPVPPPVETNHSASIRSSSRAGLWRKAREKSFKLQRTSYMADRVTDKLTVLTMYHWLYLSFPRPASTGGVKNTPPRDTPLLPLLLLLMAWGWPWASGTPRRARTVAMKPSTLTRPTYGGSFSYSRRDLGSFRDEGSMLASTMMPFSLAMKILSTPRGMRPLEVVDLARHRTICRRCRFLLVIYSSRRGTLSEVKRSLTSVGKVRVTGGGRHFGPASRVKTLRPSHGR